MHALWYLVPLAGWSSNGSQGNEGGHGKSKHRRSNPQALSRVQSYFEVDDVLRSAQDSLKRSIISNGGLHDRLIPKRTHFCYYSGVLTRMALRSNHLITLGININGLSCFVEIDGCTTKNVVGDAGTLGLLQMVNHLCNLTCRIVLVDTRSGLILLILETLRDIWDNEEITINYDAEASLTTKSQGLPAMATSKVSSEERLAPKLSTNTKEGYILQ